MDKFLDSPVKLLIGNAKLTFVFRGRAIVCKGRCRSWPIYQADTRWGVISQFARKL